MTVSGVDRVATALPAAPVMEGEIEKNVEQLEQEGMKTILLAGGQPQKSESDQAVLSKESRQRDVENRAGAEKIPGWNIENDPLWPLLLTWRPESGMSVEEKIKQLMELYQALLANLLSNTTGQDQFVQMTRLDQVLSEALNRIWDQQMGELSLLLDSYGSKEQALQMKGEIYRMVTGRQMSQRETEAFWNQGKQGRSSLFRSTILVQGSEETQAQGYRRDEKQGFIYQPSKGGIKIQEKLPTGQFSELTKKEAASFLPGKTVLSPSQSGLTPKDMKLANQFAGYLFSDKQVLLAEGLTGSSEELQGVLSSVVQIQARQFVRESGMGHGMSNLILDLVDRMIDRHFNRVEQMVNRQELQSAGDALPRSFQVRDGYRVYSYTLDHYQKEGKAESAITQGLRYALELFTKKKQDPFYREAARYGKEAGFFKQADQIQPNLISFGDLKAGKVMLEQSWAAFMASAGFGTKRMPFLIPTDHSFWGALVRPEETKLPFHWKHMMKLVAGILIFALLIWLFLKFL